jgi:hypothetical protein
MPERSSNPKRPRDLNQLAAAIIDAATKGEPEVEDTRDPAAVALGRKGGLKGGKARAEALSPEQRSLIAKRAAKARWSGPREPDKQTPT